MFGKILLPLDGSELADRVLGWVDKLLREQQVGVVTLLRVVNPDSDDSAAAEDHLQAVRKRLSEHEIPTSIHVERGKRRIDLALGRAKLTDRELALGFSIVVR